MALTMRERRWRPGVLRAVLEQLTHDGTVVDVGAGTGSVAIPIARARPDVAVIAVDGDANILQLARRKHGAHEVDWRLGTAQKLPVADREADAAVMSLLLHHLTPDAKTAALAEAARVLRPGGRLVIADWGVPHGLIPRVGFLLVRLLDGFDGTREHAAGLVPSRVADAGFAAPDLLRRVRTAWGTLELLVATRLNDVAPRRTTA